MTKLPFSRTDNRRTPDAEKRVVEECVFAPDTSADSFVDRIEISFAIDDDQILSVFRATDIETYVRHEHLL